MARSTHSCSRRPIPAPVGVVWHVVNDQPGHAAWFRSMRSVTRIPPGDGEPVWRHDFLWTALMVVVRSDNTHPPSSIEWNIRDERGHFEARWQFMFQTEGPEACAVTITEDRTMHGLRASVCGMLMVRPDHYINKYLDALHAEASRRQALRTPETFNRA